MRFLLILSFQYFQWKKLFAQRFRLRENWIKGRCSVRSFEGHTQGTRVNISYCVTVIDK